MKILTNPHDQNISFKLRLNTPYSEYEIVVTWVIIKAKKEEIKDIYPKDIQFSQSCRAIKKAKEIGKELYLVPLTTNADCTSSVDYILKYDLCPTITPIELNYLYQQCPDEHRNDLYDIKNIVS